MRRMLAVGINNYPGSPLRGCINDATVFAETMECNGDGSPNFSVRLAKDVPNKASLMTLIKNTFVGDCETAIFYFSGHGFLNDLGGYIVTPDAQMNNEGVSMNDILTIINNSAVKNKIIILDCCHSGAMGSSAVSGGLTAQIASGVTVLTASRDSQVSLEVNGHGVFTNLLLSALKGGAADILGYITPGSVYAYIDQALGPWDQRPVFKTNITQFTALRTIVPHVSIYTLRKLNAYFPSATHTYNLDPEYEYTHPKSTHEKIAIFKDLQKLESVGLVTPVAEEHMYWAAMNSGSCHLTTLGHHYWNLVKDKRI